MKHKSNQALLPEYDLSFLFSEFFTAFSMDGMAAFHSETIFKKLPSYEDYLKKGERLHTLAREKFKKEVGKIQLSDTEEKIFAQTYIEQDSLYDIASKIARFFTRPILKEIQTLDDAYALKLMKEVSMPSLKISLMDVDPKQDAAFLNQYRRKFEKYKKGNVRFIKVILTEDGFTPLIIYGALNHAHPESMKSLIFESGHCLADLGLLTAYLILYKQIMAVFDKVRKKEEGFEALAESLKERLQIYQAQYVKYNFSVYPAGNEALVDQISIDEVWSYPVHTVGIQKGYIPYFVSDFFKKHGLPYIDHPSYDACYKALGSLKDPARINFRFNSGETQLCFAYILKEPIPFHYLLQQFVRKEIVYWTPLPNSKSNHSGKTEDSLGMQFLADIFRIIASHKHTQKQMLTYYRDWERSYAKSYMSKKSITLKAQKAMERSSFNKYFGFVEFDVDTDLENVEEIAREFQAVKETYFPTVNSIENTIRFRKLGQHKALGLYYPSLACLCVDIHSPSSLIHEYGHLIDYCYGKLSERTDFKAVRKRYIEEFDKAMETDKAMQKRMKSSGKYNRSYYTTPTEIFARCFELYVSMCLGVKNSIVPATFSHEGIYPSNPEMLELISQYFESRSFVKVTSRTKERKCATAQNRRFKDA